MTSPIPTSTAIDEEGRLTDDESENQRGNGETKEPRTLEDEDRELRMTDEEDQEFDKNESGLIPTEKSE